MIESDFERRFGGLRRLYGASAAQRFFDAHVIVVGIGGVGSWAAEALARSGVGHLTLIDMDHIAESNVNRQAHALDSTLGQAKVQAMHDRIHLINPQCRVDVVDDFVTPDNLATLFSAWVPGESQQTLAVLDACDQVRAKVAMAAWSLQHGCIHVSVGAAGGKRKAQAVEVDDLSAVTHDPLLAKMRYQLRKFHGAPKVGRMRVSTVFSREPVLSPEAACEASSNASTDGSLNCHGYGSAVAVTCTFGMVAAGQVMNSLAA